ncbi:hypothetical protein O181_007900 [Austropuccinia psidii MF-1]|uniref:Reverse transcriptase Ty1/copia-type domain-containing protein n=1 Tax=Austropuccinia psidii MF-1 TaxID=1389203 RepID=A0A9Q3BNB8_9BASI|nr:hypothetical protein [Austropuccinia psidii MF-1]
MQFPLHKYTTCLHISYGGAQRQRSKDLEPLDAIRKVEILLGRSNDSAYQTLRLSEKIFYTSRHVVFFKNVFPCVENSPSPDIKIDSGWNNFKVMQEDRFYDCIEEPEDSIAKEKVLDSPEVRSVNLILNDESEEPPPRKRIKVIGPRHLKLINFNINQENILPYSSQSAAHLTHIDPITYNQAMKSTSSVLLFQAISKELQNMSNLKVWEEVPIRKNIKLIGTTWIFKTKRDENNIILEKRARLCAQGFSQTPGVDFSKTFAPTGRLNSLQTLISFSASKKLRFEQLDIKSAFLNAPLE